MLPGRTDRVVPVASRVDDARRVARDPESGVYGVRVRPRASRPHQVHARLVGIKGGTVDGVGALGKVRCVHGVARL